MPNLLTDLDSNSKHKLSNLGLDSLISDLVASPNGLSQMTLQDLLGQLLSGVAKSERNIFLTENPDQKANGFYPRSLALGSLPLEVGVPRVRSGDFRPSVLPDKHQRSFPEEHRNLLLSLLVSSRSKSAAKQALGRLNLSCSEEQLTQITDEVLEEFKLKNNAPLSPDLLALFLDAKIVDVRLDNLVKRHILYTFIGINTEGYKKILLCHIEEGNESLEGWKKCLRILFERGLRRVLITVQDDFSGLSNLIKGHFPQTHIQLCTVHMMRNVTTHLAKEDSKKANAQIKAIFKSYDFEKANTEWEIFCQSWKDQYPSFIDCLYKKREYYLNFLKFPRTLRTTLSTTNIVEGINRIFEKIRLNNSGYFQSMDDLKMKLGFSIQTLEQGKWKKHATNVKESLMEMNLFFEKHFGEIK